MADKESFAKYLDIDIESAKKFYESSSTLLDSLKEFDSTIDTYIDDFITFNNAKVSSQPAINKSIALANGFKKIDKIPTNIAYHWYKKINNQIEHVKSLAIKMCGDDFKQISDSIGSLGIGYLAYNNNTTPYHSYLLDNIRPSFYVPGNTFNKIHPKAYANLINTSKHIDALFKYNLAPYSKDDNANLIQNNSAAILEGGPQMYTGDAVSLTSHGNNLITDVNAITSIEQFKSYIRTQIILVYKKLYKIINAIKSRVLSNTTFSRVSEDISFASIVNVDIDTKASIYDMFDILQNKIKDFDKDITIDAILK